MHKSNRFKKIFLPLMIGTAALLCILVYATNVPLGITSDWVWGRHKHIEFPLIEFASITIFFAIAVFIAFMVKCYARNSREIIICICLILGCGICLDYYMMQAGKLGINENIFGVLDKYTGGYMTSAANIKNPEKYFSEYHLRLERDEDKSNHMDVHPPGNVMLSYVVLQWCRNSTLPKRILHGVFPKAVFEDLETARKDGVFQDIPDEDAVYTAGAFILLLSVACLTLARVLILAAAVKLCQYRGNYGLAALLAVVAIPSPILFMGHYDVLMFFLGAVCCFVFAMGERARHGYWWDFLTGLALGFSVFFSLAFGAMILFVFLYCCLQGMTEKRHWIRAVAIAGGGITVIILCYCCNIRIIEICLYAARNNARYFSEVGRSKYWAPMNLLDYLLFGGVFLFFMPLSEISRTNVKKLFVHHNRKYILLASYLGVLLFLLISPFSRGEMGRLLLFFKPCGLMLSTAALMRKKLDNTSWSMLIAVAALSLLLTLLTRITLKLIMLL
jgi:hypothetical protein